MLAVALVTGIYGAAELNGADVAGTLDVERAAVLQARNEAILTTK